MFNHSCVLICVVLLFCFSEGVDKWRILQRQINEIHGKQTRQEIEIEDLKVELNQRKEAEENLKQELNERKQVEERLKEELNGRKLEEENLKKMLDTRIEVEVANVLAICHCTGRDYNVTEYHSRTKYQGDSHSDVSSPPFLDDSMSSTVTQLKLAFFSEKRQRKRFEDRVVQAQDQFVRNVSSGINISLNEVHGLRQSLRSIDARLGAIEESQNKSLSLVMHGLNDTNVVLEKKDEDMQVVVELVKDLNTTLFESVVYGSWSEWQPCPLFSIRTNNTVMRVRNCSDISRRTIFCPGGKTETKPCESCPAQYQEITFNSKEKTCLRYIAEERLYTEAVAYCKQNGGHLLLIDSAAKQNAIENYLPGVDTMEEYTFIDGRSVGESWLNWKNERMDFFDWYPGQPGLFGSQFYLAIRKVDEYKWQDLINVPLPFLCEV